jgi:hypothetical protein
LSETSRLDPRLAPTTAFTFDGLQQARLTSPRNSLRAER